ARIAASAILSDVVARRHPLDECFAAGAALSRVLGLSPRDAPPARPIATAALRRLGTTTAAFAKVYERGPPPPAASPQVTLITAPAQILFLDVPDYAAVDLAVRATRLEPKTAPFAALVNGVLRNLIRARETILEESDPLDHDTPEWLATRWRQNYGEPQAPAIARAPPEEPVSHLPRPTRAS